MTRKKAKPSKKLEENRDYDAWDTSAMIDSSSLCNLKTWV